MELVDRQGRLSYNGTMAELAFGRGDTLYIIVSERSQIASGTPAGELRTCLQSIGIGLETGIDPALAGFEIHLLKSFTDQASSTIQTELEGDEYLQTNLADGICLFSPTQRGLFYSVWGLLQQMGWSWPTPQITLEPRATSWNFTIGSSLHSPAVQHRIFYCEQVEVTPDLIRWLAHHRYNTLFPSNPSRFSDPEEQVPEESLALVADLGINLIVGGNCLPWLLDVLGLDPSEDWSLFSPGQIEKLREALLQVWRDIGNPQVRFSLWPTGHGEKILAGFLQKVLIQNPDITLETRVGIPIAPDFHSRVLFSASDSSIPLRSEVDHPLPVPQDDQTLLFLNSTWDSQMGGILDPLLCRNQCARILHAIEAGYKGIAVSLCCVPAQSYLERFGFAPATIGHMLWEGNITSSWQKCCDLLEAQFDLGAGAIRALMEEMSDWRLPEIHHTGGQGLHCHDIIDSEEKRDRLDQTVAEIEESSPTEPLLELARAMATLVNLYDLEDLGDYHESLALARTIWKQSGIEQWPGWLQDAAPLAQHLKKEYLQPPR